ncbi:glutathionylspermidine synthase family protein [Flavitalea sp. BT771]|uniref:glutathionylspermidine synthase family protein n=1 Tax=Flavitalea sp. BT771 TaxID=3063329 RepID=UPI0026E1C976|nr:glutathionylspermidine synthase family protein [Flavitalea sp. BT771]MDO6429542.1 glutathionylspermidine synthase family protein [Flavitalea sp. BT771]MDV6218330.1 glutathionylspermidine synthase family protein [Flavitalea sp. BT771]
MERIVINPRNNWQSAVEKLGFGFHSTNVPYWDESACYQFKMDEVLFIEKASAELWDLCLGAVQHVMDNNLYHHFAIPSDFIPYIERSWTEDHPAIYGRFDFAYKEGQLKLLEFNADTPTSLYEAGIVQWFWLQDFDKSKDQFNSIHEKLIAYWQYLKNYLYPAPLHFTCVKQSLEDLTNTEYMRDCAIQAGLDTRLILVDDIGWDQDAQVFMDMELRPMQNIFKLYPWEWMVNDEFGVNILRDRSRAYWIEPGWKMLLSNKAILPVLWQLYPECPYILPAYFEEGRLSNYARKPILSREGANIDLVRDNQPVYSTAGEYGKEGYIYQELFDIPSFSGNYPVLGSWIIGQEPAGMGIRESRQLVTDNLSRFIPHLIV